jgi:hypothetical protein
MIDSSSAKSGGEGAAVAKERIREEKRRIRRRGKRKHRRDKSEFTESPFILMEITKLPMVLYLCHSVCVQLSFL